MAEGEADYLIWWTSQDDASRIGEAPDWSRHPEVPEYVRAQFWDRYGRAGRGRLWVPDDIPVKDVPWDDNRPTCRAASGCGGIVFHRRDLAAVGALPGFVTDTLMNLVLP